MSLEIKVADLWLWTQKELAERQKEAPGMENQLAVMFRSEQISTTLVMTDGEVEALMKKLAIMRSELRKAEIDHENLLEAEKVLAKRKASKKKARKKTARKAK